MRRINGIPGLDVDLVSSRLSLSVYLFDLLAFCDDSRAPDCFGMMEMQRLCLGGEIVQVPAAIIHDVSARLSPSFPREN
jgi:hypothetical protein